MINAKRIMTASYKPSSVEEYAGNPFIEALPDVMSQEGLVELLTNIPKIRDNDRLLPLEVKKHILARILDFFVLSNRHFDLQDKISVMIRKGYVNRNPFNGGYEASVIKTYQSRQKGEITSPVLFSDHFVPLSSSLIGTSGVGKSTALTRILSTYPQFISHEEVDTIQVVWLKLDCPKDGSLVGLCKEFFRELDEKLGSRYFEKYAMKRKTADDLLLDMQRVSAIHAIGLLVIDEIQHLDASKTGGKEAMFNFFVNVENTLGIPILTVGTLKAMKLFKTDFRQARRAGQLGTMEWLQHEKDSEDWSYLLEEVWSFQLTHLPTELTVELKEVIYECTQGITAVLTSLFMLVQQRAIELEDYQLEEQGAIEITPALIRQVFDDSFQMMRPMLEALRMNDVDALAKYDDIRPPMEIKQSSALTIKETPEPRKEMNEELANDEVRHIALLCELLSVSEEIVNVVWSEVKNTHPELNGGQISQRVMLDERLSLLKHPCSSSKEQGHSPKKVTKTSNRTASKETARKKSYRPQSSKEGDSKQDFIEQAEQRGLFGMPEILEE